MAPAEDVTGGRSRNAFGAVPISSDAEAIKVRSLLLAQKGVPGAVSVLFSLWKRMQQI